MRMLLQELVTGVEPTALCGACEAAVAALGARRGAAGAAAPAVADAPAAAVAARAVAGQASQPAAAAPGAAAPAAGHTGGVPKMRLPPHVAAEAARAPPPLASPALAPSAAAAAPPMQGTLAVSVSGVAHTLPYDIGSEPSRIAADFCRKVPHAAYGYVECGRVCRYAFPYARPMRLWICRMRSRMSICIPVCAPHATAAARWGPR